MSEVKDIEWFKRVVAPALRDYEIIYKIFKGGDFGSLDQVEFNSEKLGGNIDFWSLGWLGIFVWDYKKEKQLLNILLESHEKKEQAFEELKKILDKKW